MLESSSFGHLGRQKQNLTIQLEVARKKDDEEALQSQVNLKLDLTEISLREEIIWYQRSRKLWLQEGDHNTIYFHSMAFSHKKNNIIHCLFDANNNELRGIEGSE